MRNNCFLLFLLLIFSYQLNGQGVNSGFTANVGPSLFSLRTNIEEKHIADYGFSYKAGLGGQIRVNHLISIDGRISFSQNTMVEYSVMDSPSIRKFNYIGIPIKVRRYIGAPKRAYLGIGAFTNYLTYASTRDFSEQGEFLEELLQTEYYKKLNYGFSFSLGYEIPISKKMKLELELENSLGIRIIDEVLLNQGAHNMFWKTNNLNLLFGLSYQIESS